MILKGKIMSLICAICLDTKNIEVPAATVVYGIATCLFHAQQAPTVGFSNEEARIFEENIRAMCRGYKIEIKERYAVVVHTPCFGELFNDTDLTHRFRNRIEVDDLVNKVQNHNKECRGVV
jgi:hypothetical protein